MPGYQFVLSVLFQNLVKHVDYIGKLNGSGVVTRGRHYLPRLLVFSFAINKDVGAIKQLLLQYTGRQFQGILFFLFILLCVLDVCSAMVRENRVMEYHGKLQLTISLILFQYGNQVGEGKFQRKARPTYVYPKVLKAANREMVDGEVKDYKDPQGAGVRTSIYMKCPTLFYPTFFIELLIMFSFLGVHGNHQRPQRGKMAFTKEIKCIIILL